MFLKSFCLILPIDLAVYIYGVAVWEPGRCAARVVPWDVRTRCWVCDCFKEFSNASRGSISVGDWSPAMDNNFSYVLFCFSMLLYWIISRLLFKAFYWFRALYYWGGTREQDWEFVVISFLPVTALSLESKIIWCNSQKLSTPYES